MSNPRIQTITQKRTELDKLYVKFVDSIAALLVLINIVLGYIENRVFWIDQNISSTDTNTYRALIMIISFVLVILIIISYRLRL